MNKIILPFLIFMFICTSVYTYSTSDIKALFSSIKNTHKEKSRNFIFHLRKNNIIPPNSPNDKTGSSTITEMLVNNTIKKKTGKNKF